MTYGVGCFLALFNRLHSQALTTMLFSVLVENEPGDV